MDGEGACFFPQGPLREIQILMPPAFLSLIPRVGMQKLGQCRLMSSPSRGLCSLTGWLFILALPFTGSVTLGKQLSLSQHHYYSLARETDNGNNIICDNKQLTCTEALRPVKALGLWITMTPLLSLSFLISEIGKQ